MTSKIVVNNIEADSGISTVTFNSNIQGNLIGNVTGNVNSTGVTTVTSLRIGTGTSISSPATNVLSLGTNDSERVRIDSSGLVGIGSNSPTAPLNVVNNNANTPTVWLRNTSGGGDSPVLRVQGGANNDNTVGTFEVRDYDGNVDFKVGGTGNITIGNGNLVFSTAGKGIDFSATANSSGTMSSELFADYEEGTWTPVDNSGASLTLGANTKGHYVRVGNVVNLFGRVVFPSTGSGSAANIGGLPFSGYFPPSADVSNGAVPSGFGYISGGSVIPQIHMSGGAAIINFYNFGTQMTNANFSGIEIRFGVTYRTS